MNLYHFVPQGLEGTTLYPLNQLRDLKPDLYAKHMAKYTGLEEQDVEIPGFGFWNDCLSLMPVSPGLVKAELEKHGHDTNWSWKFYEIPAEELDWSKLVFMIPTDADDASKRTFEKFTEEGYAKYSQSLDIARHRYQKAGEGGVQPYTFGGVPHVLYKDQLDTTGLRIVEF